MLKKLLKYDLKYMIKNMNVFYMLSIIFAILVRIFLSLNQTVVINVIGQICIGCMFSMIASIIVNTLMRSWVRFGNSIYKDEAYLTHTLPVSKKDIYESKFIQTLIFIIVGFLVSVISLFIAYYSKENWLLLGNSLSNIANNFNINVTIFLIGILILLIFEQFNIIQSGYLGIIIGHRKDSNKVGYSVLFGFIAYIASQILVLLVFYLIGLFNIKIHNLFITNTILDISTVKIAMIIGIIVYILVTILLNILCVKELNKGVDVE